jgi:hypothetical protein
LVFLNVYIFTMSQDSAFTHIEPGLEAAFETIRTLEPIFHTEGFGRNAIDFAGRMDEGFWEVGASGRRYSREFILENAGRIAGADAEREGWSITEPALRELGPQTYLFTFTLDQKGRVTRRATIWRKSEVGWRILYHQGTIVMSREDDTLPGPSK